VIRLYKPPLLGGTGDEKKGGEEKDEKKERRVTRERADNDTVESRKTQRQARELN
jgi:hypothetical protein